MRPVSNYIKAQIQKARMLFGVGGVEYHFTAELTDKPNGSPSAAGSCKSNATYMNVHLEFLDDLVDDDHETDEIVIHEVGHGAFMFIDDAVSDIIAQLPEEKRDYFMGLYEVAQEQFLQRLSRSFVYNFGGYKEEVSERQEDSDHPKPGDERPGTKTGKRRAQLR